MAANLLFHYRYFYLIEIFFQQSIHVRIVGFQFCTSIYGIVYAVGRFGIVVAVEEGLYAFGKVLFFVTNLSSHPCTS